MRLTPAKRRLLTEIVLGTSAYRQAPPGRESYAYTGSRKLKVTRQADELERAGLIRIIANHNTWRYGWGPTDAGKAAYEAIADLTEH